MIKISILTKILNQNIVDFKIKKNKIKYTFSFRPAKYQRLKKKKNQIKIDKFLEISKLWAFNKGYVIWSSPQGVEIKDISGFFIKAFDDSNEKEAILKAVSHIFEL